ncbi:MAG: extracellular solute-binding protein [Candidatus Gastranaerophilales bacterium]|nr:extracellular solute-binding protein [Candidatus Gastranaerophilales bacterium]
MKKFLSLIILIILAVAGFSFYEKKHPADNGKKFAFWTIQLKPVYEKEINSIIKNFEKKHPDYKVVWVDIPIAEAQKRTLASILSSTPPDLVNLNPDFSILLAQKNALEYFSENETQSYLPSLVNRLKYQGKIYALPFYATSSVTIYNKEIFDKCALDVPYTYDDLYKISPKIKTCANIPSFAININENDTLAKLLNKYNINSIQTQNQIQDSIHIYNMFNSMYKNNFLPKDVLTINHREVVEKYMSNQTSLIVAGSNFINMIKQNALDTYNKSALSYQLKGSNNSYDVALMNLIIPKKSKNKELAREFAFELTSKENQLKLAHLTNVLPVNKEALEDDYFKNCPDDLVEKSRCISAKQLSNLNTVNFSQNNKKALNEAINKTLEEILLNNSDVNKSVNNLSLELKRMQN